jgi:flagellar biosynthetic protein FliR
MDGLQLSMAEGTLAAFLLATARTAGFVLVSPPFNTRSVPAQARVAVAIGLALPLSGWMRPQAPALASGDLLLQMVLQLLMGVTLGFLVLVAVAALQTVGDLIDVVGGFSLSIAMDPLMLTQASVMGRLHQLLAVVLLFATDGHLMVLHGLARSVQQMPVPQMSWELAARTMTADVAGLFLAALQVAGPIVAAMLITDVALGLLTRAAPALNAFALGFPLKILFTLLLTGLVLSQLPDLLVSRVQDAVFTMFGLSGVTGGGP